MERNKAKCGVCTCAQLEGSSQRSSRICAAGDHAGSSPVAAPAAASGELKVGVIEQQVLALLLLLHGAAKRARHRGMVRVPARVDSPLRYRGKVGPLRLGRASRAAAAHAVILSVGRGREVVGARGAGEASVNFLVVVVAVLRHVGMGGASALA